MKNSKLLLSIISIILCSATLLSCGAGSLGAYTQPAETEELFDDTVTEDIDPEIVDPDDIETLEDLIVAAVNEAIKKVEADSASEMSKITGGMSLPGMPGLF